MKKIISMARQSGKSTMVRGKLDDEIVWALRVVQLREQGWTPVNVDRFIDNHHAIDITEWIKENVKGPYHRNGRYFIFEDSRDAAWFLLRWS